MKAAVGTQEAKLAPSFVDVGRRRILEAADIVAPEAESRACQREAAADSLRHGRIRRGTVAAPVCGKLLAAHRRGPCKYYCFPGSALPFQKFKDRPIIKVCVIIMHLHRIGAVKICNILYWNPLTEICFEAVYTHVQKRLQLCLIPFHCAGICEIHQSHSGLPHIRLPHVPVCLFHQVSQPHPFLE